MVRSKRFIASAVAIGVMGVSGVIARAAEPSVQDMQAQINALQAKVEALEAKQISANDVNATVERVLRDADRRSQLMSAEGFTAGYTANRGFVIQSADGDFLFHPYIQFQIRNVTNFREGQTADRSGDQYDTTDNGFEIRRLKFGFEGTAYKDLTYAFQWKTDQGTTSAKAGGLTLEDAWVKYKFADNWSIKGGQFKDPLFRESLVSSTKQLAADRSLINQLLEGSDNYIQGVSLGYEKDKFRAEVAFTDGFGSQNTNFMDPATNTYNFGIAGRAEYMILGDNWKNYGEYTAMGKSGDQLVVGTGADWSQGGDTNGFWHTADVQWLPGQIAGLSLFGAYTGRYTTTSTVAGDANDSFYDWGFVAQAGYMVTKQLEPFVRFDYIRADKDLLNANYQQPNIYEITGGMNYYLKGQNAKFTTDLTWLPNGSPAADGLGIMSSMGSEEQVVLRLQFQLVL